MLKAEDLHKSYGSLEVLRGVSLEVLPGQVVGLVGASGAGKTTLLQLLGGLDRPDSGQVYYEGQNIYGLNKAELARFRNQHLGFVFQFHYLLPEFSALENAAMPAMILGKSRKQACEQAERWLAWLNLGHRLHHKPSQLSGGEQQRVAVARALVNGPRIILADEPTGNLDTANKNQMFALFMQLAQEQGVAFVVATHDPGLADQSHRLIHMRDGKVVDN